MGDRKGLSTIRQMSPCASCPYRRDAKLGFWDAREFVRLLETERDLMGSVYGCHQDNKKAQDVRACAGWLLDQRARNVPSLRLRRMLRNEAEAVRFEQVHDGGHKLFPTLEAMCRANLRAIAIMADKAARSSSSRDPEPSDAHDLVPVEAVLSHPCPERRRRPARRSA